MLFQANAHSSIMNVLIGKYRYRRFSRITFLFLVSTLMSFLFFRNYEVALWPITRGTYVIPPLSFATNIGYLLAQQPENDSHAANTSAAKTLGFHPASLSTIIPPFRILCTTTEKFLRYGSYKIRCLNFKKYAETYYAHDKLQIDAVHWSEANGLYNATILVKNAEHFPEADLVKTSNQSLSFGVVFVDIVDQLIEETRVPKDFHVIVQSDLHGKERYPIRYKAGLAHVVPHWFNSFDADLGDTPALPLPRLRPTWKVEFDRSNTSEASTGNATNRAVPPEPPLKLAMIWDPKSGDKRHAESMVKIPGEGYELLQLQHAFDISRWFTTELEHGNFTTNGFGERETIDDILNDPTRGSPYLYQLLFRSYDVLLVLAKTLRLKERYNSVQRAVSQMRSGVPVLLECVPAHADLCANDYPCGFNTSQGMLETLERMKILQLRQECVRRGIEITRRYTPRRVIDNYLRILGFVP